MLEKANHMHVFVAVVRVKLQKRCTEAQPAASLPLQPTAKKYQPRGTNGSSAYLLYLHSRRMIIDTRADHFLFLLLTSTNLLAIFSLQFFVFV